ncbi:hypothetical protein [Sorangium sp. So ce124]|uniref:hypothetical protein n=1 Tax=Sorangium sp. So ce124 TaxID=3133280 RepID=UPI003F5FD5D9
MRLRSSPSRARAGLGALGAPFRAWPRRIEEDVWALGHPARENAGATAYFIERPGGVLVDLPSPTEAVFRFLEAHGGHVPFFRFIPWLQSRSYPGTRLARVVHAIGGEGPGSEAWVLPRAARPYLRDYRPEKGAAAWLRVSLVAAGAVAKRRA